MHLLACKLRLAKWKFPQHCCYYIPYICHRYARLKVSGEHNFLYKCWYARLLHLLEALVPKEV